MRATQCIPEAGKTSVKFAYVDRKFYQWLEHRRLNMFRLSFSYETVRAKTYEFETIKPLAHWLHFKRLFYELNNYLRTGS